MKGLNIHWSSFSSLIGGIYRMSLYCSKLFTNSFSILIKDQNVLRIMPRSIPTEAKISSSPMKRISACLILIAASNHQNLRTVFQKIDQ